MEAKILSLLQLQQIVAGLVHTPQTQNVWVTAELLDVAVRGGHCYMELLQKDERGVQVAKARGVIWANNYVRIEHEFRAATGQQFASGLQVMLCVSVSMHPVYGYSLVVNAINPDYTMGDMLRRRREILNRLTKEGIIELNRQLAWPLVPQRIAVISAPGAAGYGDFRNQLYSNPKRLRFKTELFSAVMQGVNAPKSIVSALERIALEVDKWDGVVIIRGGGATSDLQAFEDYELAANVAQFPLPVAIGIGHERDVTVLDWVANLRLKTPTAVAEWLIGTADKVLSDVCVLGTKILQSATERMTGCKEQLAQLNGLLPLAATGAIERGRQRLIRASTMLDGVSSRRIQPMIGRMDVSRQMLAEILRAKMAQSRQRMDAMEQLIEAFSPMATLKRGYSITRVNGHAVRSVCDIAKGVTIQTQLADGSVVSIVDDIEQ